jgi:hypothetical protein
MLTVELALALFLAVAAIEAEIDHAQSLLTTDVHIHP